MWQANSAGSITSSNGSSSYHTRPADDGPSSDDVSAASTDATTTTADTKLPTANFGTSEQLATISTTAECVPADSSIARRTACRIHNLLHHHSIISNHSSNLNSISLNTITRRSRPRRISNSLLGQVTMHGQVCRTLETMRTQYRQIQIHGT